VVIPRGFFHQSFEARSIPFVNEQITRPLPAKNVTCGVTPGCAAISLIAGEEIQKQARMVQPPASFFAQGANISEQLLTRLALNKKLLLRSMIVTEARRNGHPLNT